MDIRNNILKDLKTYYINELCDYYDNNEAESLVAILIEHYFDINRIDMSMNPHKRLSESEILTLHRAVKELKKMKPVQYITGSVEFADNIIEVNDNVLIPRIETEELVNLIVKYEMNPGLNVLDIGTGAGCIAITLANQLKTARVSAIDISEEAIELAKRNAEKNKADVEFIMCDILSTESLKEISTAQFDVIVSNPPYVTSSDKEKMKENVLGYEPHSALFVKDEDPLIFYRTILEFAKEYLISGGRIYFEINESFPEEMKNLASEYGCKNIDIHKDIHGRHRFLSAVKP